MIRAPQALLDAINRGNCIAFVGAGFSLAAGLPTWKGLLHKLALTEGVSPTLRNHVQGLAMMDRPPAHELDQAAQMLVDTIKAPDFTHQLREILRLREPLPSSMAERLRWLKAIPFKAILTTNFDGLLRQSEADKSQAYRKVLRNEQAFWGQENFWKDGSGATTIKLHGDLLAPTGEEELVFTREDYRRKLYGDPSYITFLRSALSTSTVLYLGFSFTDAYLNELRSEVLALLDYDRCDRPIAYAVLNDVNPINEEYLRNHEGIEVLPYDSQMPADHGGFDLWIQAIHSQTNPLSRLGAVLHGKRLLWVDPHPENNEAGIAFLERAALTTNRELDPIVKTDGPQTAIEALLAAQRAKQPFDLVITHWGQPRGDVAPGASLLMKIRAHDIRCPVLVFAGAGDAELRKREALALGAQAYCFRWETLFRRMEDIFAPAQQTW